MRYQTGVRYIEKAPDPALVEASLAQLEHQEAQLVDWMQSPVHYTCDALLAQPDPWQCDVMDAITEEDSVAIRACHGVGKTALLAWIIEWFTTTRPFPKVPTTAPTFNKQVRDVLWAEIARWWRSGKQNPDAAWLFRQFELVTTRLYHKANHNEWFAVGIASSEPLNIEGYHSPHLLAVFDEAKGIKHPIWDSVQGMRTTQEAKLLVASTPGGLSGEFYKVFTKFRTTWKATFVIHPIQLKAKLKRPEAPPHSLHGTYYSARVRDQFLREGAERWGVDSPVYIARCIGDFPSVEGDVLIPFGWLSDAEDLESGMPGDLMVVSCDVARYGRDRTVILCGRGGTIAYAETIARTPAESLSPDATEANIGSSARHPRYRSVDATADACQRIRMQQGADVIVIDDTGVGGGVVDILKRRGERVIPINFGAAPTDRAKTAEERERRARKHVLDTKYVNLKAEMGWILRRAFEQGFIALGQLYDPDGQGRSTRDALMAQTSMVKYEMDAAGRIRIIDPDEQDEYASAAGNIEGKKSPDHFHSLLMYWWVASGAGKALRPMAGKPENIPAGIKRLGNEDGKSWGGGRTGVGQQIPHSGRPTVGGQAGWVRTRYR